MRGTPLKFSDPEALREQIEQYFDHCESTTVTRQLKSGDIRVRREQPTMIGLAVWLGCSKDTIYAWINKEPSAGIGDAENTQEIINNVSDLLSRARDRIENYILHAALDGDVDSRIAALVLYNHGYTAKSTEDATITVKVQSSPGIDLSEWSK